MKLAIQNPFTESGIAEVEMSRRIHLAATRLGWEVVEVHSAAEIRAIAPDLVIVLHHRTPKVAGYPTYLCMWSPPEFFEGSNDLITNILSYDGYLTGSQPIEHWLHYLLCNTPKTFLQAPFYTSAPATEFQPPDLTDPHLVYVGSNWDGPRFKELFEQLDRYPFMEVYGNPDRWTHSQRSHRGALPYDGTSVLKALHRAGVGLCLHREEHSRAEMPSMRIFEIVAAGAIAICGDHAFIREAFGDTVLYIDPSATPDEQAQQIAQHMTWIQQHPDEALAMAAQAHQIFSQHYTLEQQLLNLVPHHHELIRKKGFIQPEATQPPPQGQVQIIVRVGGRSTHFIRRALDSIAKQTYADVAVILVRYQPVEGLDELLSEYTARMPIRIVDVQSDYRSTSLWAGLQAVESEFYAILDDDDVIHPNHIYGLVSLLARQPEIDVAYSGTFRVMERSDTEPPHAIEAVELRYYRPFNLVALLDFQNFIPPNCYVARTTRLRDILPKDPLLKLGEDFCLILFLCYAGARFQFSYDATAEVYWRSDTKDNATYSGQPAWRHAMSRLRLIFWNQEFAPGRTILTIQDIQLGQRREESAQAQLQEMERAYHEAKGRIEAMQSSKFWKLRSLWFKLKRRLGLPTEAE